MANGHADCVAALLASDASLARWRDDDGCCALHAVQRETGPDIVAALLAAWPEGPEAVSSNLCHRPLCRAIENGATEAVVRALLAASPGSAAAWNRLYKLPAQCVTERTSAEAFAALVEHGGLQVGSTNGIAVLQIRSGARGVTRDRPPDHWARGTK